MARRLSKGFKALFLSFNSFNEYLIKLVGYSNQFIALGHHDGANSIGFL